MNKISSGPILLVGEGDFSLSLSLRKVLPNNVEIFASSLLSENKVFSLHQNSQTNVRTLFDLGVHVLFEVDATKLNETTAFAGKLFSHIIFNFPHWGGKSNVAKNRLLLRNFFASCQPFLHNHGSVCITLCRGQGGTPADGYVRNWNDSWQVVGAGAYSHYVLQDMWRFDPNDYLDYGCTGYRSTDRRFHMTPAWTYVFKKVVPVPQPLKPSPIIRHSVYFEGLNFLLRPYLAEKLARNLLEDISSPLHLVQLAIKENFQLESKIKPVYRAALNTVCDKKGVLAHFENHTINCHLTGLKNNEILQLDELIYPIELAPSNQNKIVPSEYILRPTLLSVIQNLQDCDFPNNHDLYIWSGAVCLRCEKRPNKLPVSHEMVGIMSGMHTDIKCLEKEFSEIVVRILTNTLKICEKDISLANVNNDNLIDSHILANHITDKRSSIPNNIEGKNFADGCIYVMCHLSNEMPSLFSAYFDSKEHFFEVEITSSQSSNQEKMASCNQVDSFGSLNIKKVDTTNSIEKVTKLSSVVGYIGVLQKTISQKRLLTFVINLDTVSMLRYSIPDVRLLWCNNNLFCNQFRNLSQNDPYCYQPISLFPPLWRHDLSIWDNTGSKATKSDIIDIATDIAGDCLSEIHLRDKWIDPKTGGISWCFREVYQSPYHAISHDLAHDFQNAIRLTVARELGVTLR